jgi:hypothetical protein
LKWSRLLSACIGVTIGTGNGVRVVKRAGSDIGTGTGGKLATLVGRKFGKGTGTKVVNGVGGWNGSVAGGTGNVNGQFSVQYWGIFPGDTWQQGRQQRGTRFRDVDWHRGDGQSRRLHT